MKEKILLFAKPTLIIFLLLGFQLCNAQDLESKKQIKNTIISFLKWHKSGEEFKLEKPFIVPRYNGKDSVKTYYDTDSLELYFNKFRKTNFVSERYISELKAYFTYYGQFIHPEPLPPGVLVKSHGMDSDFVLDTFEPEVVLDNLDKATITKLHIIYNKALVSMHFSEEVDLIFQLTKDYESKRWLIDFIGPDNTSGKSLYEH